MGRRRYLWELKAPVTGEDMNDGHQEWERCSGVVPDCSSGASEASEHSGIRAT